MEDAKQIKNIKIMTDLNKMNWTEPKPPTEGTSYYDHITTETPLGRAIIEWKSWKYSPSYSITIGDDYIDTEYDLEEAKILARNHLIEKHKELSDFLFFNKS